jgi:outer membrane murein-binding lipoprotein Lpp
MSEDGTDVILLRLLHIEETLDQIYSEVKRTNGRVTRLEMESAKWDGVAEGKRMQTMIITSVISGCFLAGIIWFVTQAI